jgi:hypothetical protein
MLTCKKRQKDVGSNIQQVMQPNGIKALARLLEQILQDAVYMLYQPNKIFTKLEDNQWHKLLIKFNQKEKIYF